MAKKVTFRTLLIQTLKYWRVLEIFWSNVHQNAISDLQTKFQLILTSTFWNFHEKCLESVLGGKSHFYATKIKILKSFGNFLVKSTSECYFWLANKVSTDSNEYFLKFSWKVFRINFRPKKSLLSTFDSNFKILNSFRNFLVKRSSECYFWLANNVSTDSNEYFLKFSWKVFTISFRPKKSLLGHFWFKL